MDTVTRTRGDGRSSDLMTHYIKDKNTKKEFKDKLKKLQQENQMLLTTHRIKFANMTAERDKLKEKIKKQLLKNRNQLFKAIVVTATTKKSHLRKNQNNLTTHIFKESQGLQL